MMKPASTRGTTSLRIGSVPNARALDLLGNMPLIRVRRNARSDAPASINAVSGRFDHRR